MNQIQFWILTGLSGLVAVFLILHIFLVRQVNAEQNRLQYFQQVITEGQSSQAIMKQLAIRIYQDSQKSGSQALKDLMVRQQISYTPGGDTNAAPADGSAPAPTH